MHEWLLNVFDYPTPLGAASIIGRTVVVYIFLVAGLRLFGKRQLGQMNLYDLVLIIVIADSVQNAMVGNDVTLFGGLIAACVLFILNRILAAFISRSPVIESKMVGDPQVIVQDGLPLTGPMKKQGITEDQLMAAIREHGIDKVKEVKLAVLEVDGAISIVPAKAEVHRTQRHYRGLRLD